MLLSPRARRMLSGGSLSLLAHPLDGGDQLLVPEGLEQVVHRPQLQRRPGVLKLAVGCEQDYLGLAAPGPQLGQHLNAVHFRHAHIGDNQVGVIALHRFQALQPVGSLSRHHAVHFPPVHAQNDAFADGGFIVHHKNFQHGIPSSLFRRGSRIMTRLPWPGALAALTP